MDTHAFIINSELGFKTVQNRTGTVLLRVYTNNFSARYLGLPVPKLPPGGSVGTGKISGTVALLLLGTLCLHVENWKCRAKKLRAPCRNFGVPCPFFSACKCGFFICCFKNAVKLPVSGHPRDQVKWPLKRGVRLWEVKNVVFVCSQDMTRCRGLRDVSAYGGCPG